MTYISEKQCFLHCGKEKVKVKKEYLIPTLDFVVVDEKDIVTTSVSVTPGEWGDGDGDNIDFGNF